MKGNLHVGLVKIERKIEKKDTLNSCYRLGAERCGKENHIAIDCHAIQFGRLQIDVQFYLCLGTCCANNQL